MTTQEDIRGWLERGLADPNKPTHVIVMTTPIIQYMFIRVRMCVK